MCHSDLLSDGWGGGVKKKSDKGGLSMLLNHIEAVKLCGEVQVNRT